MRERPRALSDGFPRQKHVAVVGDGDALPAWFRQISQVGTPEVTRTARKKIVASIQEERIVGPNGNPSAIRRRLCIGHTKPPRDRARRKARGGDLANPFQCGHRPRYELLWKGE